MIITRTPLRISLGGGGTDLPSFYRSNGGGFLVAAAVSKYIYIAVNRNFDDNFLLKYSAIERTPEIKDIVHPILREALLISSIERGVELSSMADIPAGTGLGSSGAFAVGVLKALAIYSHRSATNEELAELACHIEIDRLGEPVGKQDQYATAIGGLTAFTFRPDDRVDVTPVVMPLEARHRFEENLVLFYTGVRRSASDEIRAQVEDSDEVDLISNLREVRAIGHESCEALQSGDLASFAELLTRQWKLKLSRAPSDVHRRIDSWIDAGLHAGALGGKLVGAGGGGFLLFYAEAKADLRVAMAERGLEEVRFTFDYEGSKTVVA